MLLASPIIDDLRLDLLQGVDPLLIETVLACLPWRTNNKKPHYDRYYHQYTRRPSNGECPAPFVCPVSSQVCEIVKKYTPQHKKYDKHLEHKAKRHITIKEVHHEGYQVGSHRRARDEERKVYSPATNPNFRSGGVASNIANNRERNQHEYWEKYNQRSHLVGNSGRIRVGRIVSELVWINKIQIRKNESDERNHARIERNHRSGPEKEIFGGYFWFVHIYLVANCFSIASIRVP